MSCHQISIGHCGDVITNGAIQSFLVDSLRCGIAELAWIGNVIFEGSLGIFVGWQNQVQFSSTGLTQPLPNQTNFSYPETPGARTQLNRRSDAWGGCSKIFQKSEKIVLPAFRIFLSALP